MTAAWNFKLTLIRGNLERPKTILDVGANISQMTKLLLLSAAADARVISFEPNRCLQPLGEKVEIALSDKDGTADFVIPAHDDDWGTINALKDVAGDMRQGYKVRQARLQTLIEKGEVPWAQLPKPILMKIDTEGSEKKVLDGTGKYLHDVKYVLIEVENAEERGANYNMTDICCVLREYGFDRMRILYSCYDGPEAPAYSDVLFWKEG